MPGVGKYHLRNPPLKSVQLGSFGAPAMHAQSVVLAVSYIYIYLNSAPMESNGTVCGYFIDYIRSLFLIT